MRVSFEKRVPPFERMSRNVTHRLRRQPAKLNLRRHNWQSESINKLLAKRVLRAELEFSGLESHPMSMIQDTCIGFSGC